MVGGAKNHILANLNECAVCVGSGNRRVAGRGGSDGTGTSPIQRSAEERGEVAVAFSSCGHRGSDDATDELASALIVGEEEGLVSTDRTAEDEAELIAAKFGFIGIGRSGRSEKIAGVQVFVAEELEDGAVKIVAAGFGGEIDDAAVESAECGGGIARLNVELAYGVNDGKEGDLTRAQVEERRCRRRDIRWCAGGCR